MLSNVKLVITRYRFSRRKYLVFVVYPCVVPSSNEPVGRVCFRLN